MTAHQSKEQTIIYYLKVALNSERSFVVLHWFYHLTIAIQIFISVNLAFIDLIDAYHRIIKSKEQELSRTSALMFHSCAAVAHA